MPESVLSLQNVTDVWRPRTSEERRERLLHPAGWRIRLRRRPADCKEHAVKIHFPDLPTRPARFS